MSKHSHYFVDVSALESVDVYRMIELIGITCPVAQHVFKKAWATGRRGHKDLRRDWQDIADSATRRLQMMDEDAAKVPAEPAPINARTEQWPDESRRVELPDEGYTGQGGVMVRCPDCIEECCPCIGA